MSDSDLVAAEAILGDARRLAEHVARLFESGNGEAIYHSAVVCADGNIAGIFSLGIRIGNTMRQIDAASAILAMPSCDVDEILGHDTEADEDEYDE